MAYEHPLAFVLGLEGIALLKAFGGEHDREFVEARLGEIRRLLDSGIDGAAGVDVDAVESAEGYDIWAETYDVPNPAFGLGVDLIRTVALEAPAGVALDAACGTGRIAALLAECGHHVIGVDSSAGMLDRAVRHVPSGEFRLGELQSLPVAANSVDLVTCALALTHVPALAPVFREFVRVLRPGGHVAIVDVHPERVARNHIPTVRRADGTPARVRSYHHRTGDYVRAALEAGLRIRRCEEPVPPNRANGQPPLPATTDPGPWQAWPWSLYGVVPEAAAAAESGVPSMLLWHFRRD
ncbi:class I SAM-dependent methyltransferase [Nocardia sp. NPDC088792]|uniref:class I SAM-dependent methyltransferase n=1 Tax=Nocardia sp. NPDC088792 TaxID=3364332 RepID=UPI0038060206